MRIGIGVLGLMFVGGRIFGLESYGAIFEESRKKDGLEADAVADPRTTVMAPAPNEKDRNEEKKKEFHVARS